MSGFDPHIEKKSKLPWYFAMVPLEMSLGSSAILSTLLTLSLGANITEIGLMLAVNAAVTIIFSLIWGKLSDLTMLRKKYLMINFLVLSPLFLILSMVNSVSELIIVYGIIAIFTSSVTPIALMLAVETGKNMNWEKKVINYQVISRVGRILGLIMNTVIALFFQVNFLFYVSAVLCLVAFFILWRLGEEPEITLERSAFPIRRLWASEKLFSSKAIFHFFDIRRLKITKIRLSKLKPHQLLFLAVFVQWTGIFIYFVGQTPLMKALGMSDSLILASNAVAILVSIIAFSKIVPRLKNNRKKLIKQATIARTIFLLGWAGTSLLLIYPSPFAFLLPFLLVVFWPITFVMVWQSIITYSISSSPVHQKSSNQGALISTIAIGNVVGSTIGGFIISIFGYTIGFFLAAVIVLLSTFIFSRIDMI